MNLVNVPDHEKARVFLFLRIYFLCRDWTAISKSSNFKSRQLPDFLFCFWCLGLAVGFFFPQNFFWAVAETILALLKRTKKWQLFRSHKLSCLAFGTPVFYAQSVTSYLGTDMEE